MDHPCYKCATSIDETLPFCPHCGAPQIRVASPDEDAPPEAPQYSGDATPRLVTPASWPTGSPANLSQPAAIQWELAWKGALLSGLGAAVLTAMPVMGLGCCLWLLGAGALAVWLYQRRVPGTLVTSGMGMRIGAVSGAVGYVATTIWSVFRFASNSQEFRTAMQEQMDKSLAANPDPRAQEIMRQFMGNLNTPQGLATFFVLILAIMAVVFVIFSAAGGALGASMFARRRDLR
ncbi:MAG TPA: hypothetical protein VIH91_01180 [Terriglobales bacterium]